MGYYHWKRGVNVRKIQKVGNSYMVAIPPYYLERLKLKKGDEVALEIIYDEKDKNKWIGLAFKPLKGESQE